MKNSQLVLRAEIKTSVAYQISLKSQRKTVYLKVGRTMEPHEATWRHQANRIELRAMYAALAHLTGREISDIDSLKFKTACDKQEFDRAFTSLIKKYEVALVS